MEFEKLAIVIEGQEAKDLYQDLYSLEVELDEELAAMFRIRLAIKQQPDGSWSLLDDKRLTVWKKVTITAGLDSGVEQLIEGYITNVRPSFEADLSGCALEVWGMDRSLLLDREEKLKAWPNVKDSDIATDIFQSKGFSLNVEDTGVIHDKNVSTIIQRETDMQFLKRLALRNGFDCFVEGTAGYFRKPRLNDPPQPVLAVQFGDDTSVNRVSLEIDALRATRVSMTQIGRADKKVLDVNIQSSLMKSLGKADAGSLLPPGIDPAQLYIAGNVTTGNPEMTALCQGLYHEAEWFVTGEGEVAANHYGHVLKPRKTVTIKGMGETYSGVYYVSHVTHSFDKTFNYAP